MTLKLHDDPLYTHQVSITNELNKGSEAIEKNATCAKLFGVRKEAKSYTQRGAHIDTR